MNIDYWVNTIIIKHICRKNFGNYQPTPSDQLWCMRRETNGESFYIIFSYYIIFILYQYKAEVSSAFQVEMISDDSHSAK